MLTRNFFLKLVSKLPGNALGATAKIDEHFFLPQFLPTGPVANDTPCLPRCISIEIDL